jgi:hypothetical protein
MVTKDIPTRMFNGPLRFLDDMMISFHVQAIMGCNFFVVIYNNNIIPYFPFDVTRFLSGGSH